MPQTLLLPDGKHSSQSLMVTSVTGQSTSSRLFRIYDPTTTYRFLVDTGAEVSVVTPTAADRKYRQELTLQAANSTPITTYGSRSLTLDLGLRRTFRWVFTVADVTIPILGADFLCHFGLVVDMGNHSLSDSRTHLEVMGRTVNQPALCLTSSLHCLLFLRP